MKNLIKLHVLFLLLFFILVGCAQGQTTTETAVAAVPTHTVEIASSPTAAPTATIEPTPTPNPWPSIEITSDNLEQLTALTSWGRGAVQGINLLNNGSMLLVRTPFALMLLEADDLSVIREFESALRYAVSPDGSYVVFVTQDGRVLLLSVQDVDTLHELYSGEVTSEYTLAFSPGSELVALASFSYDQSFQVSGEQRAVRLYETATGAEFAVLAHGDFAPTPSRIRISPDLRFAITKGFDSYPGTLAVWDIAQAKLIGRAQDGTEMSSQPFLSDKFLTFSDNSVFVWEPTTASVVSEIGTGLGGTNNVIVSEDEKFIEIQGRNLTQVRSLETGQLLSDEQAAQITFPRQASIPDTSTETNRLWELGYVGGLIGAHQTADDLVFWLNQSSYTFDEEQGFWVQNSSLKNWGLDGTFTNVSLPPGELKAVFPEHNLVVLCNELTIVYSTTTQSSTELGPCTTDSVYAIDSSGNKLAQTNKALIEIYDPSSGEMLATLRAHSANVQAVEFSADGTRLASYGDNPRQFHWAGGELFVWNLEGEARRTHSLTGFTFTLANLTFTPDMSHLVASEYRTLRLWRLSDSFALNTLSNSAGIRTLLFSNDGQLLLAGGDDGTVSFWDWASSEQVLDLKAHANSISKLYFLKDGAALLSVSMDGKATLWGVEQP